jgi:hypothetical protein
VAATRRAAALTTAHQRTLRRLVNNTEQAIGQLWDRYADVSDAAPFASRAARVARSGQRLALTSTSRYLATYAATDASLTIPAIDPVILDDLRNGTPPEQVYERGIITARAGLADGDFWEDAMAKGRARSVTAGGTDVGLAARAAMAAGAILLTRAGVRRARFKRVAGSSACSFCASAHGTIYDSPNGMPLHPSCACGLEPLLGPDRFDQPAPEVTDDATYTTHEHGELGTIPGEVGHTFTEV